MTFSEWLKAARTKKGLSFRELAAKSGVSKTHIFEIEGNKAEPGLSVAEDLAKALGVKLSTALRRCGK